MVDMRKVEVFRDEGWTEINFSELGEGDKFRLFESTGEKVVDPKGRGVWIASGKPFLNKYDDMTINIY